MGREQREEVVDRRAVSTQTNSHKGMRQMHTRTQTHTKRYRQSTQYGLIREGNIERKGREKSDMSKWFYTAARLFQVSLIVIWDNITS